MARVPVHRNAALSTLIGCAWGETCWACARSTDIYFSKLSLSGFRNHLDTQLELAPGLAVFQGANGQGKSNLLEAAYLLAIAKSPRTGADREVLNWDIARNGGHAQVLGVAREGDHTVQAQVDIDVAPAGAAPGMDEGPQLRKSFRINGIIRPAAEFVGNINVVSFEASDLDLVFGPPSVRRRFLDIVISQSDPAYLRTLQRYSRVVMQRNQLLRRVREDNAAMDELDFWDGRLATEGAVVTEKRQKAVSRLYPQAAVEHGKLGSQAEELEVEYRPRLEPEGAGPEEASAAATAADVAATLLGNIPALRRREVAQGVSLVGPHRDELTIRLNGQDAGAFASRGQARCIALALKLAEASLLTEATGRRPVLALDDVLSELDPVRRRLVLSQAAGYEQTLLTVTEFEAVDRQSLEKAWRYTVQEGKVSPVG